MRDVIKDFVGIVSENLSVIEPIYEFGSLQVEGQEGYADLRPFFPGKKYLGCDLRPGLGVDMILDLHKLELPDASAGAVLILDTLEHVEYPRKALAEIHRILAAGGMVIASSVMQFPIHEYPHDYWRFTPDGFKSLLKGFEFVWTWSAGEELFPHTVLGIGVKSPAKGGLPDAFTRDMDAWKQKWFYPEGLSPAEIEEKKRRKQKKQKSIKRRLRALFGKQGRQ